VRVVIDGLPLHTHPETEPDTVGPMVSSLLQSWTHPHGDDELHLIVDTLPSIDIPDWVTVHQVSSEHLGPISRLYARMIRVPRLCRSLKAHVRLGLQHTGKVAALAYPRRTVVYDLFDQPEADSAVAASLLEPEGRIVWSCFAHRLRVHLVDAVARADWVARRRPIQAAFLHPVPIPVAATIGTVTRPSADISLITRFRTSVHPRRSVRWIAAASASTLVISAAAAASVDLAVSHSIPVSTPHQIGTTGATHPVTVGSGGSGSGGFVPLPPPNASTTTPTNSTSTTVPSSTTAPSATSTSGSSATSAAPSPVTVPSLPLLTLPTLTLPTITTPSLPIPGLTCTTGPTQTTSPLQSIINLCTIAAGGLPLGTK
jgi:hypothetical protein